ncbi:hypothetical protein [Aeropyrum pernix]|uniref:hypothetical protein n=1 Tax=Aeropyrum pernix TaxID=56636 RepID=UPI0011E54DC3|nr:hypothetical protein [Aeropyrum pernix]
MLALVVLLLVALTLYITMTLSAAYVLTSKDMSNNISVTVAGSSQVPVFPADNSGNPLATAKVPSAYPVTPTYSSPTALPWTSTPPAEASS